MDSVKVNKNVEKFIIKMKKKMLKTQKILFVMYKNICAMILMQELIHVKIYCANYKEDLKLRI